MIPAQAGIQTPVYPGTRNLRRHCHSHIHRHSGQFCVLRIRTRSPCDVPPLSDRMIPCTLFKSICSITVGPLIKGCPLGQRVKYTEKPAKKPESRNGTKWGGKQKIFVPPHLRDGLSALIPANSPPAGGENGTKWDSGGTFLSHLLLKKSPVFPVADPI